MEKYSVGVVTGTRAEYGLLRPLLFKLRDNKKINLKLIVTGSHLSGKFGYTKDEIIKDGFDDFYAIPIPIDDDSKTGMAYATGEATKLFAELFNEYNPDLLVVLGDRFEIFSAVSAAHLMGIRVAHIAGGDVTEGAVDDAIRHCLTKMSYLHFPGCDEARKRIIQMGESPDRVFNVGEFGVENCINTEFLTREALAESVDFYDINKDYSVITFHPVTMESNTGIQQLCELIKAMDSIEGMSYIITMANADAGGREINEKWVEEGKKHKNWKVVTSLGVTRYLSALKYAKLCIGNSSSGLVEAPSLGVPTVNIGDRQKGRIQPDSVINCNPKCVDIVKAIYKGLSEEWIYKTRNINNPFGNGTSSKQTVDIILKFLETSKNSIEKSFYDIDFEVK